MSGTSEFLPLKPSERVTELEKKLCSTLRNVVRGTSEFLPFLPLLNAFGFQVFQKKIVTKTAIKSERIGIKGYF